MKAPTRPVPGKLYRSVINVIGAKLPNVNVPSLGYRIDNFAIDENDDRERPVLGIEARGEDDTWENLYLRMEINATGLSIGTFTHCWASEYIYDEDGQEVWRKPGTIRMIVEKEGDPLIEEDTLPHTTLLFIDISVHIARFYSRAFPYHHIGLLLLRTPLVGFELNAEILLDFVKIGELVTASRTNAKPTLRRICKVTEDLVSDSFSSEHIEEFYIVRSRDAAHDFLKSQNIERRLAVDCKLWAELLVVRDWQDRGEAIVKRRAPQPGAAEEVRSAFRRERVLPRGGSSGGGGGRRLARES